MPPIFGIVKETWEENPQIQVLHVAWHVLHLGDNLPQITTKWTHPQKRPQKAPWNYEPTNTQWWCR